jgi:LysM repeat protein
MPFDPTLLDPPQTPQTTQEPSETIEQKRQRYAKKWNIPDEISKALVFNESTNNPRAHSDRDASGLMQLIPRTAQAYGVTDVYDPDQNLDAGHKYLSDLLDQNNGSMYDALAHWHGGWRDPVHRSDGHITTAGFINKVLDRADTYRQQSAQLQQQQQQQPDLASQSQGQPAFQPSFSVGQQEQEQPEKNWYQQLLDKQGIHYYHQDTPQQQPQLQPPAGSGGEFRFQGGEQLTIPGVVEDVDQSGKYLGNKRTGQNLTVTAKPGQTIQEIAADNKVTPEEIAQLNGGSIGAPPKPAAQPQLQAPGAAPQAPGVTPQVTPGAAPQAPQQNPQQAAIQQQTAQTQAKLQTQLRQRKIIQRQMSLSDVSLGHTPPPQAPYSPDGATTYTAGSAGSYGANGRAFKGGMDPRLALINRQIRDTAAQLRALKFQGTQVSHGYKDTSGVVATHTLPENQSLRDLQSREMVSGATSQQISMTGGQQPQLKVNVPGLPKGKPTYANQLSNHPGIEHVDVGTIPDDDSPLRTIGKYLNPITGPFAIAQNIYGSGDGQGQEPTTSAPPPPDAELFRQKTQYFNQGGLLRRLALEGVNESMSGVGDAAGFVSGLVGDALVGWGDKGYYSNPWYKARQERYDEADTLRAINAESRTHYEKPDDSRLTRFKYAGGRALSSTPLEALELLALEPLGPANLPLQMGLKAGRRGPAAVAGAIGEAMLLHGANRLIGPAGKTLEGSATPSSLGFLRKAAVNVGLPTALAVAKGEPIEEALPGNLFFALHPNEVLGQKRSRIYDPTTGEVRKMGFRDIGAVRRGDVSVVDPSTPTGQQVVKRPTPQSAQRPADYDAQLALEAGQAAQQPAPAQQQQQQSGPVNAQRNPQGAAPSRMVVVMNGDSRNEGKVYHVEKTGKDGRIFVRNIRGGEEQGFWTTEDKVVDYDRFNIHQGEDGSWRVTDQDTGKPYGPFNSEIAAQRAKEHLVPKTREDVRPNVEGPQGSISKVQMPAAPAETAAANPATGEAAPVAPAEEPATGRTQQLGKADTAEFTDEQGRLDMEAYADHVGETVWNALDSGAKVTYVAENGQKRVPIVKVTRGMMEDEKGQRWGTMSMAQGDAHVEIEHPPATEATPAAAEAAPEAAVGQEQPRGEAAPAEAAPAGEAEAGGSPQKKTRNRNVTLLDTHEKPVVNGQRVKLGRYLIMGGTKGKRTVETGREGHIGVVTETFKNGRAKTIVSEADGSPIMVNGKIVPAPKAESAEAAPQVQAGTKAAPAATEAQQTTSGKAESTGKKKGEMEPGENKTGPGKGLVRRVVDEDGNHIDINQRFFQPNPPAEKRPGLLGRMGLRKSTQEAPAEAPKVQPVVRVENGLVTLADGSVHDAQTGGRFVSDKEGVAATGAEHPLMANVHGWYTPAEQEVQKDIEAGIPEDQHWLSGTPRHRSSKADDTMRVNPEMADWVRGVLGRPETDSGFPVIGRQVEKLKAAAEAKAAELRKAGDERTARIFDSFARDSKALDELGADKGKHGFALMEIGEETRHDKLREVKEEEHQHLADLRTAYRNLEENAKPTLERLNHTADTERVVQHPSTQRYFEKKRAEGYSDFDDIHLLLESLPDAFREQRKPKNEQDQDVLDTAQMFYSAIVKKHGYLEPQELVNLVGKELKQYAQARERLHNRTSEDPEVREFVRRNLLGSGDGEGVSGLADASRSGAQDGRAAGPERGAVGPEGQKVASRQRLAFPDEEVGNSPSDNVLAARRRRGETEEQRIAREAREREAVELQSKEVSTRKPSAKKKTPEFPTIEDPYKENLVVGLDGMKLNRTTFERNMAVIREPSIHDGYPNLRPEETTGDDDTVAEHFVRHVVDNLRWLYNQVPEDIRQRSKLWYDGARKIASQDWVRRYGTPDTVNAGVMAVLSPQKDWFMNVHLAERVIDIMKNNQDAVWDKAMTRYARTVDSEAYQDPDAIKAIRFIKGKRLSELTDPYHKALFVRTWDEAHSPRGYQVVSPEGNPTGWKMNDDQKTRAKAAWNSFDQIAKAISIIEDPSQRNIDDQLGNEHKVRNFYNNIINPNSTRGHVTIDTHAVAAALLRAFSGESLPVKHNFGSGKGSSSSKYSGSNGTYGLYAEAYRRLANELGILPREVQSITWEAVRGLFPDTFKDGENGPNTNAIEDIWRNYHEGRITLDEARQQIYDRADGIDEPDWYNGSAAPVHDTAEAPSDQGEVSVNGRTEGARTRRGRGAASGDVSAESARRGVDDQRLASRSNRNLQVSFETARGPSHPEQLDWYDKVDDEVRQRYHDEKRDAFLDENGNHQLADALGLKVTNTFNAPGVYEGVVSPGSQTKIEVPEEGITPEFRAKVEAFAAAKARILKQDAYAWTYPNDTDDVHASDGVAVRPGRQFTPGEAAQLGELLKQHLPEGVETALIGSEDGIWVRKLPGSDLSPEDFFNYTSDAVDDLDWESSVKPPKYGLFTADGNYVVNDWRKDSEGERYQDWEAAVERPDLLRRAADETAARLDKIDRRYQEEYGSAEQAGSGADEAGRETGRDGQVDSSQSTPPDDQHLAARRQAQTFYSRLEREVEKDPSKRGFGFDDIRAFTRKAEDWVRKLNSAKLDEGEMKWTGVRDWLTGQQGKEVGRDDLLNYLRAHRIAVEELPLGMPEAPALNWEIHPDGSRTASELFQEHADGSKDVRDYELGPQQDGSGWWAQDYDGELMYGDSPEEVLQKLNLNRRMRFTKQEIATNGPIKETKWRQYNLPGGKQKYQELRLRLVDTERQRLQNEYENVRAEISKMFGITVRTDADNAELARLNKRAADAHMALVNYITTKKHHRNDTHWSDTDDVLGHVRFNERTTPDGKRVLFIEEIQSDWHQDGRKVGYQGDEPMDRTQLPLGYEVAKHEGKQPLEEWRKALYRHHNEVAIPKLQEIFTPEVMAQYRDTEEGKQAAMWQRQYMKATEPAKFKHYDVKPDIKPWVEWVRKHVPEAYPDELIKRKNLGTRYRVFDDEGVHFAAISEPTEEAAKQKALERLQQIGHFDKEEKKRVPDAPFKKNWQELVMKRMIRHAAEKGYDAIAWTTGEHQFQRWGSIGIRWEPDGGKPAEPAQFIVHQGEARGRRLGFATSFETREEAEQFRSQKPYPSEWGIKEVKAKPAKPGDGFKVTLTARGANGRIGGSEHKVRTLGDARRLPEEAGSKWAEKLWEHMQRKPEGGLYEPLRQGMHTFYDKSLGEFANKYGKQWGTSVVNGEVHADDEPATYHIFTNDGKRFAAGFTSKENAKDFLSTVKRDTTGWTIRPVQETTTVPMFEVNQKMKDSVLADGQPLAHREKPSGSTVEYLGEDETQKLAAKSSFQQTLARKPFDRGAWMKRAVDVNGGNLSPQQAQELNRLLVAGRSAKTQEEKIQAMRDVVSFVTYLKPTKVSEVVGAWYRAGMLSGLGVTAKNITANTLHQALMEFERIPAGMADWAISAKNGTPRQVQGLSPAAWWHAYGKGQPEAIKNFWNSLVLGATDQHIMEKYDQSRLLKTNLPPVLKQMVEWFPNFVFNLHGAQDGYFRTLAFRRALYEQAALKAKNQGGNLWTHYHNPDAQMQENAMDFASFAVFQNDNKLSSAVAKWKQERSPVTQAYVTYRTPFLKTGTNVFQSILDATGVPLALQSTKLLQGKTAAEIWDKVPGQHRRTVLLAASRAAMGHALFWAGVAAASAGIGNGVARDDDKGQKNAKEGARISDGSINIGGRNLSLHGLGPAAALFIAGMTFHNRVWGKYQNDEGKLNNLLEAASLLVEENPFSEVGGKIIEKAKQHDYVGALLDPNLSKFSPFSGISRDIARYQDPQRAAREVKGDTPLQTQLNQLKSSIPNMYFNPQFNRNTLPVRRDYRGQVIEDTNPVDPFKSRPVRDDRVNRMVLDNGFRPTYPMQHKEESRAQFLTRRDAQTQAANSLLNSMSISPEFAKSTDRKEDFKNVYGRAGESAAQKLTPPSMARNVDVTLYRNQVARDSGPAIAEYERDNSVQLSPEERKKVLSKIKGLFSSSFKSRGTQRDIGKNVVSDVDWTLMQNPAYRKALIGQVIDSVRNGQYDAFPDYEDPQDEQ